MNSRTYIIAEIGGNHNGDLNIAKKLIFEAKKMGVDAVKFQTFNPYELTLSNNPLAVYQKENIKKKITPIDLLKLCSLSNHYHRKLYDYSRKLNIEFMSSAFDEESLIFLKKNMKIKYHKLPSGEITNSRLVYLHGFFKNKLIISTGMSTVDEIFDAIGFYICGYLKKKIIYKKLNSKNLYKKFYDIIKNKISILHCVSNYPTKIEDTNLLNIKYLEKIFKINIGFSDHTKSLNIPAYAVLMGAKIIEKHITINNKLYGPDHKFSLQPNEFKQMVKNIRDAENSKGSKERKINHNEKNLSKIVRKILVAKKKINKNQTFSFENITSKRGNNGMSAKYFFDLIDKKSNKNYLKDDKIKKNI